MSRRDELIEAINQAHREFDDEVTEMHAAKSTEHIDTELTGAFLASDLAISTDSYSLLAGITRTQGCQIAYRAFRVGLKLGDQK